MAANSLVPMLRNCSYETHGGSPKIKAKQWRPS